MNLYRETKDILCSGLEPGEAGAIALLLLEKVAGIDRMHALMGDEADSMKNAEIISMARRIAKGEPPQYVIGETEFLGLTLKVGQGVLIPRPETEELVELVIRSANDICPSGNSATLKILDIGTGSGCIAISIAKNLPDAGVYAWDISNEALAIAEHNSAFNGTDVTFMNTDVLTYQPEKDEQYSIIVSNPPYICNREATDMEKNVLCFEPHLALFVPDDNPLLFYRRIAELGKLMLKDDGMLFFEINREYGNDTVRMLESLDYECVELHKDQFGNDRMIKAIKR